MNRLFFVISSTAVDFAGFLSMSPRVLSILVIATCCGGTLRAAEPGKRFVDLGLDGKLVYQQTSRGDRMPDFSYAGFGGGAPLPDVPVAVVVVPAAGESGPRIQQAIDAVAKLPPAASGFR